MSLDWPILLTALGIAAATIVARHRAIRFGLDVRDLYSLTRWLLIGVLVGGHLSDAVYCRFDQTTELVKGHGWRSVGGLFGGLAATLLWGHYRFATTVIVRWPGWFDVEGYWFIKRAKRAPILAFSDVLLSVFPLAWLLHRIGFVLGHTRPDVATLDLVITTGLLALVMALWKGRFRAGFYVCLAGLTYAPARVVIGFFGESAKSAPYSEGSLTLTQWGFAIATLMSLGLLIRLYWASLRARFGVS